MFREIWIQVVEIRFFVLGKKTCQTHTHMSTHTCIHTHTNMQTRTCAHMHVGTYICNIYIYSYIHIHKHTQTCKYHMYLCIRWWIYPAFSSTECMYSCFINCLLHLNRLVWLGKNHLELRKIRCCISSNVQIQGL